MREINNQELQRIQKILLRLHICMLLCVTYFTLKAYAATEPVAKAFYIFTSLTFGAGVAWLNIRGRIRHARRKEEQDE